MSAHADGGPLSRVCARKTLRSAPQRHERKFSGTRFWRVTFKIFEKNLKKIKNRPQGARGGAGSKCFFTQIFIISIVNGGPSGDIYLEDEVVMEVAIRYGVVGAVE